MMPSFTEKTRAFCCIQVDATAGGGTLWQLETISSLQFAPTVNKYHINSKAVGKEGLIRNKRPF
jgi:hypothetical protein